MWKYRKYWENVLNYFSGNKCMLFKELNKWFLLWKKVNMIFVDVILFVENIKIVIKLCFVELEKILFCFIRKKCFINKMKNLINFINFRKILLIILCVLFIYYVYNEI